GAFRQAVQWRAGALNLLASPFFLSQRVRIARLAVEHRLPTTVPHRTYTEAGGLMSYGPDFRDLNRRAVAFVDKILKGTKPAELPVEQATKFELLINMKTAKTLGLRFPRPCCCGRIRSLNDIDESVRSGRSDSAAARRRSQGRPSSRTA